MNANILDFDFLLKFVQIDLINAWKIAIAYFEFVNCMLLEAHLDLCFVLLLNVYNIS